MYSIFFLLRLNDVAAMTHDKTCFSEFGMICLGSVSREMIPKFIAKFKEFDITKYGVFSAEETVYYQFPSKGMKTITVKYKKSLNRKHIC